MTIEKSIKRSDKKTDKERQNTTEHYSNFQSNSLAHSFADPGATPKAAQIAALVQPKPTSKKKLGNLRQSQKKQEQEDNIKKHEAKYPMTSAEAIAFFGQRLNDNERDEILNCGEIYYVGKDFPKKQRKVVIASENNFGFDDEKGDYIAIVGEHIGYRYEIIDMLDTGAFGEALKCYDHKQKREVALKIIRSKKRFYYQATVEIKILEYIQEHDKIGISNVVKILDYFIFRKHIVIYNF